VKNILGDLPFHDLTDDQLIAQSEIKSTGWHDVDGNSELCDYLNCLCGSELLKNSNCKCSTVDHFNHIFKILES
jgi:hypothetical protein